MQENRFTLIPFPGSTVPDGLHIQAILQRVASRLSVRFEMTGPLEAVDVPSLAPTPERRHELWTQTCFEFFIGVPGEARYWEFNLSPSGHWNVYRFDDYRQGMREESTFESLPCDTGWEAGAFHLEMDTDLMRIIPGAKVTEVGLSAVVRLMTGEATYWALAHRAGRPDFHRRDGYITAPGPST